MFRSRWLARALVVVATMLTPLLGGAIIYYSLRKSHPKTADFANLLSVVGFAAWSALFYTDWARSDGRVVLGVLGAIGALATDFAIRVTRRSEHEEQRAPAATAPSNGEL
jgi:hypothetical protein